jgi:hypothetical protein
MHWWPSEIPLGWKSLGWQCTPGPDPVDPAAVEPSGFLSPRKVKGLFPTEPPR